jgi:hypothetical protein
VLTRLRTKEVRKGENNKGVIITDDTFLFVSLSERGDLNPGPPEPHSGALPGCATLRLSSTSLRNHPYNNEIQP